jgi:hypothetical protein
MTRLVAAFVFSAAVTWTIGDIHKIIVKVQAELARQVQKR